MVSVRDFFGSAGAAATMATVGVGLNPHVHAQPPAPVPTIEIPAELPANERPSVPNFGEGGFGRAAAVPDGPLPSDALKQGTQGGALVDNREQIEKLSPAQMVFKQSLQQLESLYGLKYSQRTSSQVRLLEVLKAVNSEFSPETRISANDEKIFLYDPYSCIQQIENSVGICPLTGVPLFVNRCGQSQVLMGEQYCLNAAAAVDCITECIRGRREVTPQGAPSQPSFDMPQLAPAPATVIPSRPSPVPQQPPVEGQSGPALKTVPEVPPSPTSSRQSRSKFVIPNPVMRVEQYKSRQRSAPQTRGPVASTSGNLEGERAARDWERATTASTNTRLAAPSLGTILAAKPQR